MGRPRTPETSDARIQMVQKREAKKREATAELEKLAREKPRLLRPVFFVPGWTDERNSNWMEPFDRHHTSAKQWADRIFLNPEQAAFITFDEKDSECCSSFLDMANLLKKEVWSRVSKDTEIDVVGHSMGGLDIRAAIIDQKEPLLNIKHCVTVGTPHEGTPWAKLIENFLFQKAKKLADHLVKQGKSMGPTSESMQFINTLENQMKVLDRVKKLYCFSGTKDYVVFSSSRYRMAKIEKRYGNIIEPAMIEGAAHSGVDSITQDPRALENIFKAILDRPLRLEEGNKGYFVRQNGSRDNV